MRYQRGADGGGGGGGREWGQQLMEHWAMEHVVERWRRGVGGVDGGAAPLGSPWLHAIMGALSSRQHQMKSSRGGVKRDGAARGRGGVCERGERKRGRETINKTT